MPTEAVLDSRFAALPRLIRDATNPNATGDDIRHFMEELLDADPALFAGALQFLSRDGHGFVLIREMGGAGQYARGWARWPLRRLFSARRPSLLSNPVGKQSALAVPFDGASERHVVVAPLQVQTFDAAQQTFLDSLQSITVPAPILPSVNDRIPRFVWLGTNGPLARRVGSMLRRRGWPLVFAPTFGHALIALQNDRVDIALLEAGVLHEELVSLRAVRHAAKIDDAPIVYFTDNGCEPEVQTLVDYCLPTDVSEGEMLRTLKAAATLVPGSRSRGLRAVVEHAERSLRACVDHSELAQRAAEAALQLGAEAVSVMLVDPAGGVHAWHLPLQGILGDHWPTPFMTGEVLTHTHAGDSFFEDAFDDVQYALRLRQLRPISAAAIPIGNGPDIIGTLLAFSLYQPMYAPEFDALTELCERVARSADALSLPGTSGGPWQQAMLGETMIEAFAGARAHASIHVRSNSENAAVVMLEPGDDRLATQIAERLLSEPQAELGEVLGAYRSSARGLLLAIVENSARLRFACEGLPLPMRVPVTGPAEAIKRAESCETDTIVLGAQSATVIYCSEFAAQVEPAKLVAVIQRGLRTSRAMLARGLPSSGMGTQNLAFACVTMLSSTVESGHSSGFA